MTAEEPEAAHWTPARAGDASDHVADAVRNGTPPVLLRNLGGTIGASAGVTVLAFFLSLNAWPPLETGPDPVSPRDAVLSIGSGVLLSLAIFRVLIWPSVRVTGVRARIRNPLWTYNLDLRDVRAIESTWHGFPRILLVLSTPGGPTRAP